MRITIVGAGYVGLITAACLARFSHHVTCVDKNIHFIDQLKNGRLPFFEPDLSDLLQNNAVRNCLHFSYPDPTTFQQAECVFIAVGTPETPTGEADTCYVFDVIETWAPHLRKDCTLILKSTVPVGTNSQVETALNRLGRQDVRVLSNPEFLREGAAIVDFMAPDRLVFGVKDAFGEAIMRKLYQPLIDKKIPILVTQPESAEMIKYASNSFLALKVTFINQIADICEKVGADVETVATGMGLDRRIAPHFLKPGPGYGGSCFPKDTRALCATARQHGSPLSLIEEVIRINHERKQNMALRIAKKFKNIKGKHIAILGITFKANTDDTRESPALDILHALDNMGAVLKIFDPQARPSFSDRFKNLTLTDSPYAAANNAEALVILTEWPLFQELNFSRLQKIMKNPHIFDWRNLLDPETIKKAGFGYDSIGRSV